MDEIMAASNTVAILSGTRTQYPDNSSIAELFTRVAAATPQAIAVVDDDRQLTYAELDAWSSRLAARLVAAGVEVGDPVGVLGERCLEAPAAMLAVLKAGAAYVPLDRTDPHARLRSLTDELAIRQIVTLPGAAGVLDRIPALPAADFRTGAPPQWRTVAVGGAHTAYIMFTSGSTGVPKAVAVPHRAVARLVLNTDYVRLTADDRVSNAGHLAFDASVFEIWGALLNGARVVIVDPATLLDPLRLEESFTSAGVTVAFLSIGVFHHCARFRPAMFRGLRCLITGGDVLNPDLFREVLAAGPPEYLLSAYGPTENTTFSTTHRIVAVPPGTATIPIGRPIANSTCVIVAADGTPAAVGVEGELWLGGDGVALGYVNSPVLTAQRFVPDPAGRWPGARLFRSGDMARLLPDGTIDFLGRRDRMVKVRGFRVELDEIEAVLARCPGVGEAAVVVSGDEQPGRLVSAFYVADRDRAGDPPSTTQVRGFLAERLPHFMVPARLEPVDRLPLTSTGKIDRAALSRVTAAGGPAVAARGGTPTTPLQAGLARLWAEVLDVDEVGPQDTFFELGGNSLTAARVFARLQTTFGIDAAQSRFLTSRLLADPSLAGCAEAVAEARRGTLSRDMAGEDIDFRRESALEVPIIGDGPLPRPASPDWSGADILLTGATGFVGSYLLRRLLNVTGARIHCLVRAIDAEQAFHRLEAEQTRYQLGGLPRERVIPVVGDLAQPLLGLRPDTFDAYAARLALILHAAAYVNFTYPYPQLADVTVHGVREIIRLAGRRRVPVHFVSTLAVLAGFGAAGVRAVSEDTPLDYPEHLYMGYTESKWVAEAMLGRAAERGLPVGVYRPYEVSGDLTHGAWNLENATCALLRLIVDMGIAPDIDLPLDLVPVDVLAAQIAHIALTRPADTHRYHLANPRPAMLADMTDLLIRRGYPIRPVPFLDWVPQAVRYACDHPEHPFTPFVPLWVDRSPRNALVVKEMFFASHFPRFTRKRAESALAGLEVQMPAVDATLLDHYARFFERVGFFAPPR